MSLKRYLFLLIALLIIILAVIQLSFVSYIKGQIEQEVQGRSQALSERVIDFVAEGIDQPIPASEQPTAYTVNHNDRLAAFYHIKIHPAQKQIIEINDSYSLEIADSKPFIELIPKTQSGPAPRSLKALLKDIKVTPIDNDSGFSLLRQTSDGIEQKTFEFDRKDALSSHYFNYLSLFIAALSLIALLLAYWLARHISKPLSQLTDGFKALEDGQLGVTVTAVGVSEIKKTLERFNQMSEKLEQLSKQEQQFIAAQHMADIGEMTRGLAHALRNPINTIGLSLEQMALPSLNDQQRQQLAVGAREKIASMDNTIKSLLTLAAQHHLEPQALNLVHVVQDIILELSTTSTIAINFDSATALPFVGHESELRAILHSVMVNAVEASDSSGEVVITVIPSDNTLDISITDSGSGLAPEIIDMLFQPHITTKPEGAGMGLYIARRLCQLHYQGQLSIENRQSGGAIANITLHSIIESE